MYVSLPAQNSPPSNPEYLPHLTSHSQTQPTNQLTSPSQTEQNQLSRPTKTHTHRHSRKMPRDPLARLQPQDRAQPARPTARHPPQRRPVPLVDSRRRQEEARRQRLQEEQAEIQETSRGEGSRSRGGCGSSATAAGPSRGTARAGRPNDKSTLVITSQRSYWHLGLDVYPCII